MSRLKTPTRPIHVIAREIIKDWSNVNYAALPYLRTMRSLESVDCKFGQDSGKNIVSNFLCNASTWRGEVARRVKKELNLMVK